MNGNAGEKRLMIWSGPLSNTVEVVLWHVHMYACGSESPVFNADVTADISSRMNFEEYSVLRFSQMLQTDWTHLTVQMEHDSKQTAKETQESLRQRHGTLSSGQVSHLISVQLLFISLNTKLNSDRPANKKVSAVKGPPEASKDYKQSSDLKLS